MQAFEFQATVTDGVIILPEEYKTLIKESVKVIILQNETDTSNKNDMIQILIDNPIEDKNFKPFNREDIYDKKTNCFLDTNILLYAFIKGQDEIKREISKRLILTKSSSIFISTQVINEVCINLIKKEKVENEKIKALISSFYNRFKIVEIDKTILLKATELRIKSDFSFWDSPNSCFRFGFWSRNLIFRGYA